MCDYTHIKTSIEFFKDYCGLIFTVDIYLKILDDYVPINFGTFFSQIFVKYLRIKIRDNLCYSNLLQNYEYFLISYMTNF